MLSFRRSPSAGLWCIIYKAAGVCFTLCLTLLSRFRHIAAFISTMEVNQGGFIPKRLRRAPSVVTLNLSFFSSSSSLSSLLPRAYFKDRARNGMLVLSVTCCKTKVPGKILSNDSDSVRFVVFRLQEENVT